MSRGNRKGVIFDDDYDRLRFLNLLGEAAERYRLRCQSYCLMGNHYHAVVETPDGNLSDAMQLVNGAFTQESNRRHQRIGHLLHGRFKSVIIGDDTYLRAANTYVVRNPVAAGLVAHPTDWKWSSYRATAGHDAPPDWLCLDWLNWVFGGRTLAVAQRRYREFVATPRDEDSIEKSLVFGEQSLHEAARAHIGANLYQVRLPREYRALARPTLDDIFPSHLPKIERNARVIRAHAVHGYRLSEIAACLQVHPNTLSRIVRALRVRSG